MKLNFTLLFVICFAVLCYGQQISGKVTDAAGESIAYVNIAVLNTAKGAVTNKDGSYQLTLEKGSYQLVFSAMGYASQIQSIEVADQALTVDVTLFDKSQTLDEVVVTALRAEQRLVETPVSVTSLSSKAIEDTRTWELKDLTGLVPNYFYGEIGVGFQQIQSIRGISVFSENPAIATYVDGVNQLDILANGFQFVDIESIEVLRGPQGTLFGRNAMGGVINIRTKQPTNKTEGFADVTFGNLGLQRYSAGFRTPLVKDKLFLGITALRQQRNGFLVNDTTGTVLPQANAHGKTVGDETATYGNVFLKWLASSRLDVTLNVKSQVDQSNASGFFVYQLTDELARNNPNKINLGRLGEHRRDILNTALSANYRAPKFNFNSTTTFQQIGLSYNNIYDANFGGGIIYASYRGGSLGERPTPQQVFTQELKITSLPQRNRLNYTAGAFFFSQNAFEPTTNIAIDYGPVVGPFFLGPLYAPGVNVVFRNEGQNLGVAAYGQVSYKITDKLEVTGGLRYDQERRENTFNSNVLLFNGVETATVADTTVSGTFRALSPKLAFTYSPNANSSVFVSYLRGFRAGGVNTQRVQGIDLTYEPEFSDNIEAGYKRGFAENRLFLAATAYYIDWKDLQFFTQFGPNLFGFDNVGDARSYGVEAEVSAIPLKNLRLEANLGFNESEYRDFTLAGENLSGNRLANAPKSTLFLAAQYNLPLSEQLSFMLRGEYRHVGQTFSDRENQLAIADYSVINLRTGFTYKQKFDLIFWVRNLTDQRFIAYASASTANGNRNSLISPPRTLGVTLSAKF
jgi:iron complex outermembrane receptor protein